MQFISLIEHVSELDVCTIDLQILGEAQREIRHISYLDGTEPRFRPDTLYVGAADAMPDLPARDDTVNLICCGASVPVRAMGVRGLNYLRIASRDCAPLVYNHLRLALSPRPAAELERMQRLTEALLSGRGLQHMADVAGEVFGNPMRISDVSYTYLVKLDMAASPDPFLQEAIDGRTADAHVDYGKQQHLRERQRDLRYPVLNPIPEAEQGPNVLGTAMLSGAVFIQGVVIAYCSLYDAWRRFTPEDYALLNHFCALVSLEMQKSSYYTENKGVLYSYFLHDLLTARLSNISNVRERLRTIGWTPKHDLYILAVDLRGMRELSVNPTVIAQRLHNAAGHSIYVLMGDVIALLLSRDKNAPVAAAPMQKLLADTNLRAGLSARFTDILEAPRHYESALAAGALGAALDPEASLCRFPDYVVPYLLQNHDRSLLFNALAEGALARLLAHDRQQAPPLLPTLRAWLAADLSSSAAAAALGIHKNTLLYRLEKIREITGLALSGREELLQLLLGLKLLDCAGAGDSPARESEGKAE